ncbi:glutathione S-transferase [Stakelama pacifica]|uniref:Glutathione S-transferase n=1 Tax=Stakelama pacifica TaxID=517720 RepID=A0A4R6FL96_9SPHN|nr:glutathione S-transferase [Stakelama pacifica]TDN82292.1 glutathione S-transferase [Stakelama pacifica]GGO95731.1 glutathione S-transferase [Stakelama pacifica]
MAYNLWYWPGLQGRGEFVRLSLEAAGIEYRDCGREEGAEALIENMRSFARKPYAPPYLEIDGIAIAHVANILMYLGERHHLAPSNMADRLWLHQVELTIADMVAEVHNVHHPVGGGAYYEDQKAEAARAAKQFREERIPKFLTHFEQVANTNPGEWLIDHRWCYTDCSLFQLVEGLRYMFPNAMRNFASDYPALMRIRDQVADLPGIKTYLNSDRRVPFNQDGIFRHYPELDEE